MSNVSQENALRIADALQGITGDLLGAQWNAISEAAQMLRKWPDTTPQAQPEAEPVASTYWGDDGYEHKERRSRNRAKGDPRIDHLFEGFDNVIRNAADDYNGGYLKAMRQEFGELMRDAAPQAQPAPAVPAVPLTGGTLGMEETHPSYVAGFKAGHAAGRKRAESAAPAVPAAQPLTDERIDEIWDNTFDAEDPKRQLSFRQTITRAIEQAHGITQGGKHG